MVGSRPAAAVGQAHQLAIYLLLLSPAVLGARNRINSTRIGTSEGQKSHREQSNGELGNGGEVSLKSARKAEMGAMDPVTMAKLMAQVENQIDSSIGSQGVTPVSTFGSNFQCR
eukprot:291624-Amorphochlora_amoeboformis.AAC.1